MNTAKVGTLLVVVMALVVGVVCAGEDVRKWVPVAAFVLGVLTQALLQWLARRKRLLAAAALGAASPAHALPFILAAIGVGAVVGLALWGLIKIVSALLTVEHIQQQREDAMDQAMISVPFPQVELAASPAGAGAADAAAVVTTMPGMESVVICTSPWLYLTRPQGAPVDYSTNLVDWQRWDEQPIDVRSIPQCFWRIAP